MSESQTLSRVINDDVALLASEVNTASGAAILIGGHAYEYQKVSNCSTCFHPLQRDLDNLLRSGIPARRIKEYVDEDVDLPSPTSLWRHRKNHLGMEQFAKSMLMESYAAERGMNVEEVGEFVLDSLGALKAMKALGLQKVGRGEIEVNNISELLAVVKLDAELESMVRNETDASEAQAILAAYAGEVRRLLSPEQREQLNSYLMTNPAIRKAMGTPDIEGESWEDDELIDVTEQEGANALALAP